MSTIPSWSRNPQDYMRRRGLDSSAMCARTSYAQKAALSHRTPLSPVSPPQLQGPDDPASRFVMTTQTCRPSEESGE